MGQRRHALPVPQGKPVIAQVGGSPAGRGLARDCYPHQTFRDNLLLP